MPRVQPACPTSSFGLPLRDVFDRAESLGITNLELDAVGDLAPDQLSQTARRQMLIGSAVADSKSVPCEALTRLALTEFDQLDRRMNYLSQCMQMAYQFGATIVIHKGCPIASTDDSTADKVQMNQVLEQVNGMTNLHGVRLALETAYATPSQLAGLFSDPNQLVGLGVSYLPDLVMASREPVIDGLRALHQRILHLRLRDMVRTGSVATGFKPVGLVAARYRGLSCSPP